MNITKNGLFLSIVLLTTFNAVNCADRAGSLMLQAARWGQWAFTKGPVRLGGVTTGTIAGFLQAQGMPITEKENGESTLILAGLGIVVDSYLAGILNDIASNTTSYEPADLGPYACKFMLSALVSAGIAYTGTKAIRSGRRAL